MYVYIYMYVYVYVYVYAYAYVYVYVYVYVCVCVYVYVYVYVYVCISILGGLQKLTMPRSQGQTDLPWGLASKISYVSRNVFILKSTYVDMFKMT